MIVTTPGLNIIESWDVDPRNNGKDYLDKKARFVAVKQVWTGTEFATWFLKTDGLKHTWLLKLFSWLNGFTNPTQE